MGGFIYQIEIIYTFSCAGVTIGIFFTSFIFENPPSTFRKLWYPWRFCRNVRIGAHSEDLAQDVDRESVAETMAIGPLVYGAHVGFVRRILRHDHPVSIQGWGDCRHWYFDRMPISS